MPCRRAGDGIRLSLSESRAGFDELNLDSAAKVWRDPGGADEIAHQTAAAGPELDQIDLRWSGEGAVRADAPHPDQLSEHLGCFGSGDEITRLAERVARRVIAVPGMTKTESHVSVERHRAFVADHPGDCSCERRPAHVRRERSNSQMPIAIRGTDRIIPMVMNPRK